MNLFEPNTKSTNENAIVNLPAGVNDLDIIGARLHIVKSTQEKMIAMDFSDSAGSYSHFFAITNAQPDRRRIAQGDMKAVWDGCKLSGQPTLERLPNFAGKKVRMHVEHQPKDGGGVFANIKGVWAPDDADAPALSAKKASAISAPAPAAEVLDPVDDQLPDHTDNPLAETPAPAATPAKKWKKAAPAA